MFTFLDPLYGEATLPHPCDVIIKTRAFQRLRDIAQLGPVRWVFPSATHSRMEHALGVAYLANCWMRHLQDLDVTVTAADILCVTIAGLLRSVGHGPWSHLYEEFLTQRGVCWHHAQQSVDIARLILNEPDVKRACADAGLGDDHARLIIEIMMGNPLTSGHPSAFMFEIVINTTTGIDVETLDQLARDAHHLGMAHAVNVSNLLASTRLVAGYQNKHIGFPDKMRGMIRDVFIMRQNMHAAVYAHPEVVAVCVMAMGAWVDVPELVDAATDLSVFLSISDIFIRTCPRLFAFNDDLMFARLPKLTLEVTGDLDHIRAHTHLASHSSVMVTSPIIARAEELAPPYWFTDDSQLFVEPLPPNRHVLRVFKINIIP